MIKERLLILIWRESTSLIHAKTTYSDPLCKRRLLLTFPVGYRVESLSHNKRRWLRCLDMLNIIIIFILTPQQFHPLQPQDPRFYNNPFNNFPQQSGPPSVVSDLSYQQQYHPSSQLSYHHPRLPVNQHHQQLNMGSGGGKPVPQPATQASLHRQVCDLCSGDIF